MTPQRIPGGLIRIAGVVVPIVGTNEARWIVDRVNRAATAGSSRALSGVSRHDRSNEVPENNYVA